MRLPFELDPQIIHHIIHSQAGSIGKALIELLMNSVDAQATLVHLNVSKQGFVCRDDGSGFASRDDVLRYFGRFGTPHQEGDATYGRFRLGRGQIMAHASTEWCSNAWQMIVDTKSMGYAYDLNDCTPVMAGCEIKGNWYEPLTDTELATVTQEIRDLVRYTPIVVELNERVITRQPGNEKWDFEDELAYYRVKAEGAVSIYNQGVLVRHDSTHLWGAGGLVVTKRALGLNVSRTEILRKTCPVWKPVAKQFQSLADALSKNMGSHRKTEARREKTVNDLLSGAGDLLKAVEEEEIITILPGKRHITLRVLFRMAAQAGGGRAVGSLSVVENPRDVPKGEQIARSSKIPIIHPVTLQRFGCHSAQQFWSEIERCFLGNERVLQRLCYGRVAPQVADFATLRAVFVERTCIVSEKDLDRETRRAWVALRWCLQMYSGVCRGQSFCSNGIVRGPRMEILLGDSNVAEAWTDGKTYVAFSQEVIKRLRSKPIDTVSYVLGLLEHEIAHEGDSLDCGHDDAFYQRFHDLNLRLGRVRQWYIHKWLRKYADSMEREGVKRDSGASAWYEQRLRERVGTGREKRGLDYGFDDLTDEEIAAVPSAENAMFRDQVNLALVEAGASPKPPDWKELVERAQQAQAVIAQKEDDARRASEAQQALEEEHHEAYLIACEATRSFVEHTLGICWVGLSQQAKAYFQDISVGFFDPYLVGPINWPMVAQDVKHAWESKAWEGYFDDNVDYDGGDEEEASDSEWSSSLRPGGMDASSASVDPLNDLPANLRAHVQPSETWWSLNRNAAAAGMWDVNDYLKWRMENAP